MVSVHSSSVEQNRSRRFEKQAFKTRKIHSALDRARYTDGYTDVYEIIAYIRVIHTRMRVNVHHFRFVIKL